MIAVIDFHMLDGWPSDLLACLDRHYTLLLDWETGWHKIASEYDAAVCDVERVLQPYALIGWHCTRLTLAEMAFVRSSGMQLPTPAMLNGRVDALAQADACRRKLRID